LFLTLSPHAVLHHLARLKTKIRDRRPRFSQYQRKSQTPKNFVCLIMMPLGGAITFFRALSTFLSAFVVEAST
jgi:hypothetical protein